jgi:hypothetical protein
MALSHSSGKMKVKVAPFPSLLFSPFIMPPCDSMMYLDIYNPRPVPLLDLVMNLGNSLVEHPNLPQPVFLTLTTA